MWLCVCVCHCVPRNFRALWRALRAAKPAQASLWICNATSILASFGVFEIIHGGVKDFQFFIRLFYIIYDVS